MAYKKRTDKKRQKLNQGEFVRKSDGRYCFKYKDPVSGGFKVIYAVTLEKLREKEKEILESLNQGIDIQAAKNTTLNELFYHRLDQKEKLKKLNPSTRLNYENMWETNCSEFGKAVAADIEASHVVDLIAGFVEKGLSKSSIKLLHNLVSSAFDDGIARNIVIKNPCKTEDVRWAKASGAAEKKRDALRPEEQEELLRFLSEDNIYNVYFDLVTVALYTGLRVGELAGLTWDDVDMKKMKISVERQLRYGKTEKDGNTHFYVSTPKTAAGIRTIDFGQEVREALKHTKQMNFMLGKTQKAAEVDGIRNFVFLNKNGTPYATNAVNFILKNIVDAHNREQHDIPLPHISAHILRHSFATRALEGGTDYKVLQESLGHTKIGITMDVYARSNNEEWKRSEMLKISKAN